MIFRTAALIIILVFSLQVSGQDKIEWYSLKDAIALNREAPKKFMVDVYTDWCGWCKKMDATSFSDPSVASFVNEHFYPVKFNAEFKDSITLGNNTYRFIDNGRKGYHEVAAILTKGRLSYPTIVYLDEELHHIGIEPGYKDAEQLKQRLIYFKEEKYKDDVNPIGM